MLGRVLQAVRVRQSGIQRVAYKRRPHLYPGPQRGVVVRVIAADVEDEQRRASPPQVICDVLLARGGIVRAERVYRQGQVALPVYRANGHRVVAVDDQHLFIHAGRNIARRATF